MKRKEDTPTETKVERHQFKANCDGKQTRISRTNGEPHTIYWPKNAGECTLHIFSVDKDGKTVRDTTLNLQGSDEQESYTSPKGAYAIVFECDGAAGGTNCVLEIDRR